MKPADKPVIPPRSSKSQATDDFFPGYTRSVTDVGKERGWAPMTRAAFEAQLGVHGALFVGNADDVVAKVVATDEAVGGIARLTFQMNAASLPQAKVMSAIDAIGTKVAPAVRSTLGVHA